MAKTPAFKTTIRRDPAGNEGQRTRNGESISEDRKSPITYIIINDVELNKEHLINAVSRVYVDERADGLSTAEIDIVNEDSSLTDVSLFKSQNIVQIWTGYSDTGIVKRGSFRINSKVYRFKSGKDQIIRLKCVSPEYDMAFTEKRRTWRGVRDSDIAREIALEHGFEIFIDQTPIVHENVTQVESDMKFLEKRALLNGFDVYVDEQFSTAGSTNMVLHFHEPKFFIPRLGPVYWAEDENRSLDFFEVEIDTWFRGVKYIGTQVDPLTKEEIIEESSEEKEIPFQRNLRGNRKQIKASEMSTINNTQPQKFLVEQGHKRNREEVRTQVQKFSEFTRYAMSGCGKIIGLEQLSRRRVLSIRGIGRMSGDYYITRATHIIEGYGYEVSFSVISMGPGEFEERSKLTPHSNLLNIISRNAISSLTDIFSDISRNVLVSLEPIIGPSNFSVAPRSDN